jgi:hypothetical protein
MKAEISVCNDFDKGFEPVGVIQTVGGKAVADLGAQKFMMPYAIEPDTGVKLTPGDGDRYVAAMPAQYAANSRISADIINETKGK